MNSIADEETTNGEDEKLKKDDEDVVDADFEEVDNEKKDK